MTLFIILGSVVLIAFSVVGFLFYLLNKESSETKDQVVAIKDPNELKKSFGLPEETKNFQSIQISANQAADASKENLLKAQLAEEYSLKEEAYEKKVQELKGELQAIASKAQEQKTQAYETIDQLKAENDQLKKDRNLEITAAQANLIKAEQTIESLRDEQMSLGNRLNESQVQITKLQEEAVAITHQMTQEIVKTKADAEHLMIENQELKKSIEAGVAEAGKTFVDKINALEEENQALKNVSQDLTMSNQKLKELNSHLIEKSEGLQWELTKMRAQMTSFERACENYQNQLQGAFDKTGSIEKNNSALTETNNRLQKFLDELQKQNEELTKRTKLFEFEVEKNRNQIVSLERDNASLKANSNSQ